MSTKIWNIRGRHDASGDDATWFLPWHFVRKRGGGGRGEVFVYFGKALRGRMSTGFVCYIYIYIYKIVLGGGGGRT